VKDWDRTLVTIDSAIVQALEVIERGGIQIAFVVDQDRSLLGAISDGDIRRGLLHGVELGSSISEVMKKNPVSAPSNLPERALLTLMNNSGVSAIPLVDSNGQMRGIKVLQELVVKERLENPVLVMAGGMGKRLLPLTENCPKPLLKVNGKPILEIILERHMEAGFGNFVFAVNYKAQMIKDYFGDGSNWKVDITYIEEERPLGTAGAISLLREKPSVPIVVTNGDVITKVNAAQLLDYHIDRNVEATMGVRHYEFEIPFGVVDVKGHEFLDIQEKPVKRCFVNAGVYVLGEKAVALIPSGLLFNMTDLFRKAKEERLATSVFPITEYWVDVGRHDDLNRVKREVGN
jgi:dTDP-glucose pyrophosphorylase